MKLLKMQFLNESTAIAFNFCEAIHSLSMLSLFFYPSEAGFLFKQIEGVACLNARVRDTCQLLRLNHVNSVPLLVDNQSIFLSFKDDFELISPPSFIILRHLTIQILLVRQVGSPTRSHLHSLLLLHFFLALHNFQELRTILPLDFLKPHIVVCELGLAGEVKLLELHLMSLPLGFLGHLVLNLCLLESFLGPDLIKSGGPVLSFLLELSHALDLLLLFLFDALVF